MSTNNQAHLSPYRIIEREKAACRRAVLPPDPGWPAEVRLLYREAVARAFEEGLTAGAIVEACELKDNNAYSLFKYTVGKGVKELIVACRLACAKALLRKGEQLLVTEIAYAVGYSSPSGFSSTFKRHVGCTPSEYRDGENEERKDEKKVEKENEKNVRKER
jgi:AraC-like DNA-binding protein